MPRSRLCMAANHRLIACAASEYVSNFMLSLVRRSIASTCRRPRDSRHGTAVLERPKFTWLRSMTKDELQTRHIDERE